MSEITYLNYVGAERFYQEVKRKRLDFICIDVGSKVSGLAITVVSQRSSLTISNTKILHSFFLATERGDNRFNSPTVSVSLFQNVS
ncbi:hypothetical protein LWI28_021962 [Acer negundo]|uniref:Uncharacterized protein n=1 Tax=Acer negundo TaxID=4023 RepID=A0AAD5IB92_ACENE|nr:hypothetical protein LWI28_021962 [Acer negundo]